MEVLMGLALLLIVNTVWWKTAITLKPAPFGLWLCFLGPTITYGIINTILKAVLL